MVNDVKLWTLQKLFTHWMEENIGSIYEMLGQCLRKMVNPQKFENEETLEIP